MYSPAAPVEDLETARSEIEKLRAQNAKLIDFMSTACEILWESDAQHRFRLGRIPVAGGIFAAGLNDLEPEISSFFAGRTLYDVHGSPEDGYRTTALHHDDLVARRPFRGFEYPIRAADGQTLWMESSGNPVYDAKGVFQGYRGTTRNITRRKVDQTQISFMARHDALTGLPNRVLFGERLTEALAGGRDGVAVLCLDLDRFKMVNDTLGHPAGDQLLKKVADRLSSCLRSIDLVARLGGDEFAIVVSGLADPEAAGYLAQRILNSVNQTFDLGGHQVVARATIGIAIAPADGDDPETILKNADIALYRAKTDEPGTARFFAPEMGARLKCRQKMENDLRGALERQEFELVYQPICDARSCRINAFEALLRWNLRRQADPAAHTFLPEEFIPIAEEIGLIFAIGEWALRQACADAASWPGDIRVAVNLSPGQLKGSQLLAAVNDALAASGLAASRLELEITEAALAQNADETLRLLHELHALGAHISMDDFGTGSSPLNDLRRFPVDRIKIDRSFVRDVTTNNGVYAIVRAIAGLGQSLKLTTTAEGVETFEQLAILRSHGCDEVQGFLFSLPVPAGEAVELARTGVILREQTSPHEADLLSRFGWKNFDVPQLARPSASPKT